MELHIYYLDFHGQKDLLGISKNATAVPRIGDKIAYPQISHNLVVKDVIWQFTFSGTTVQIVVSAK